MRGAAGGPAHAKTRSGRRASAPVSGVSSTACLRMGPDARGRGAQDALQTGRGAGGAHPGRRRVGRIPAVGARPARHPYRRLPSLSIRTASAMRAARLVPSIQRMKFWR